MSSTGRFSLRVSGEATDTRWRLGCAIWKVPSLSDGGQEEGPLGLLSRPPLLSSPMKGLEGIQGSQLHQRQNAVLGFDPIPCSPNRRKICNQPGRGRGSMVPAGARSEIKLGQEQSTLCALPLYRPRNHATQLKLANPGHQEPAGLFSTRQPRLLPHELGKALGVQGSGGKGGQVTPIQSGALDIHHPRASGRSGGCLGEAGEHRLIRSQSAWVRTPARPLPGCVTVGTLLSLCPHCRFLICEMGIIKAPASQGRELEKIIHGEHLNQCLGPTSCHLFAVVMATKMK